MSAEQVAPLITQALSAVKAEQDAAQEQLEVLKTQPDYATSLLYILLQQDVPLAARQMAGVLLKQFVESSWQDCPHAETKETVKANILAGLGDNISKVRSSVAAVISEIACIDFPEQWLGLFDVLLRMMGSGDANQVHGVMKVLAELASDITDNQVYTVAPVLFPKLVQLFQTESFGPGTRARVLSIFGVFTTLISHMDAVDSNANQNLLFPILPSLVDCTVSIIGQPITIKEDYKLQTECVNFLSKLVQTFPKQMGDKVSAALPVLWNLLTVNAESHITGVVNNPDHDDGDDLDSDGAEIGFGTLVQAIFEFIQSLTERKKYKAMIRKVLADVVFYLITYLSIPEYQIELWDEDPEKYVEDDDEESMNFTVRTGAMELLIDLSTEMKTSYVEALINAITRHIGQCGPITDGYNWKVYEACATALNISGDAVEDCIEAKKVDFNFGAFYNTVVLPGLTIDKPYLKGRLIWLTASYIKRLPSEEAVNTLLEYVINALKIGSAAPVMVGAMKGVYAMCTELETLEEQQVLHKSMEHIIPSLFDLAGNMDGDLLMLCLDALRICVPVRPDIVTLGADKVNTFLVDLFVKHASDTFIVSQVNEVLMTLAEIPECQGSLQNNVIPVLLQILRSPTAVTTSPKKQSEEDEEDMRSEVLDLLTVFIRKTTSPLPEIYINEVFPVVMSLTMGTAKDSSAILQSGGECVRACLAQGFHQVSAININGISGLEYILQLIGKLLDPEGSEYGALYAGRLVSSLIKLAGTSLNINDILQAVLNKLTKCDSPTIQQSMLVVFIRLFNHDLEGSMTFLQSINTPDGDNGLVYVLKAWCEIQELFSGDYETKVAVIALTKFLPHILAPDSPLASIMVSDDEMSIEGGRITRSSKQQQQSIMIPITVKIFKILVQEFSNILEDKEAEEQGDLTDEEGDVEEDEEDVDDGQLVSVAQLAHYLGNDEDDDDDTKDDPLNEVDLHAHLQQFLVQLSTHGTYNELCQALNDNERKVLSSVQVAGS